MPLEPRQQWWATLLMHANQIIGGSALHHLHLLLQHPKSCSKHQHASYQARLFKAVRICSEKIEINAASTVIKGVHV